jgi:antitoxin MazE
MKTELIRIGNSRGVRIPKPLIEQCGLGGSVDLRIENNKVVISPAGKSRAGWAEQFRAAASEERDDLLLEPVRPNDFDEKDWRW